MWQAFRAPAHIADIAPRHEKAVSDQRLREQLVVSATIVGGRFLPPPPRAVPTRWCLALRAKRGRRSGCGLLAGARVVHIFCWQACGHPEAIQRKPLIHRRFFRRITKASPPPGATSVASCPQFLLATLWISCASAPQGIDPARFTAGRHGCGSRTAGCPFRRHAAHRHESAGSAHGRPIAHALRHRLTHLLRGGIAHGRGDRPAMAETPAARSPDITTRSDARACPKSTRPAKTHRAPARTDAETRRDPWSTAPRPGTGIGDRYRVPVVMAWER